MLDGKVMGRIHAVSRSSITSVKYTFINQKPFIIAGHSNGQIAWYSAKCGTLTAVTPPSATPVAHFVDIADKMYSVSGDSVQIWANKGDCHPRATISTSEPHHNRVFAVVRWRLRYLVLYTYGYVALFDEHFRPIAEPKFVSDKGFRHQDSAISLKGDLTIFDRVRK